MESKLRRASRWFNQDRVRTLIALLELEQAFIMISASGVLYLIGGWIYILAPLDKGVWTGTQKVCMNVFLLY
jgi:predicted membrane channel-forming protein YqfA (hemolysin III family)